MNDSQEMLRRYASQRDEEAFRELVANYHQLVRSTALRCLNGNNALADDVVQLVFTDLARQAPRLPADLQLGGWLHKNTLFAARKQIRSEIRRIQRETEAAKMKSSDSIDPFRREISLVLDEAIQELPTDDRSAIILRFVEGRDLRSVGETLNVSEDAAQKRVQRAIEKLRGIVESKGLTTTTAALAAIFAAGTAEPASAASVGRIATNALAGARKDPPAGLAQFLRWQTVLPALLGLLVLALIWPRKSTLPEPNIVAEAPVEAFATPSPAPPPLAAPADMTLTRGALSTMAGAKSNFLSISILSPRRSLHPHRRRDWSHHFSPRRSPQCFCSPRYRSRRHCRTRAPLHAQWRSH